MTDKELIKYITLKYLILYYNEFGSYICTWEEENKCKWFKNDMPVDKVLEHCADCYLKKLRAGDEK